MSFLKSVPGQAGHYFYSVGDQSGSQPQNVKFWKSTNSCTSFTDPNPNLKSVYAFGFGAAQPGGATYATIYVWGWLSGVFGLYQSVDGGNNYTAANIPSNQNSFPGNSFDGIVDLSGDPNVYGRIISCFRGSGCVYIDTQDACPSVNFSNTNPNATLTGTVTLQGQHSGHVPVSSVSFYLDGTTLIGTQTTGSGTPTTYSQSWNTSGAAHGSHTLTVTTTGNCNGSASFSIPITTSVNKPANDNGAVQLGAAA